MDDAKASMGIYIIEEMAKFYGLEPYKYMKYVLKQRPTYQSFNEELEKLTPWSDRVQKVCR